MPGLAALLSLVSVALLLWAALLFALGLRRALQGLRAARRLAAPRRLLALVVTRYAAHGQYFQLTLARPLAWRWWPLPAGRAGMSLGLQMPHEGAAATMRRYSLAAWRRRAWRYELAIKREPRGRVSNWAGDTLRPGSRVRALPPDGHFVWPAEQRGPIVLLGGGIGITPMRAMLQAWLAGPRRHDLTLVWSVRERADLMDYHAEFEALARAEPRLRYVALLTGADASWSGERGRADARRLLAWCGTPQPQGIWMCASATMMDALRADLLAQGLAQDCIHFEAFGAAANADTATYTVTWQPDGARLSFQGQPSLLALLESSGHAPPSDCRNGSCGACRVRLRAGQVRQVIAPDCALAPGELLACCSVPASDLELAAA